MKPLFCFVILLVLLLLHYLGVECFLMRKKWKKEEEVSKSKQSIKNMSSEDQDTKVITLHPDSYMNVRTEFHGNQSNAIN